MLCRAPNHKIAWLKKLEYENTIIKNKGLNIINRGPNVVGIAFGSGDGKMLDLYESFSKIYKNLAQHILKTFPKNRIIISQLLKNTRLLNLKSLNSQLQKHIDSIISPSQKELFLRTADYLKNKNITKAEIILNSLEKSATYAPELYENLALLAKLKKNTKKSIRLLIQAKYYRSQIKGFVLSFTDKNAKILSDLKSKDKTFRKAMNLILERTPSEQASFLASTVSTCHNCKRDLKEGDRCREMTLKLFKLGPKYHHVFENLLNRGIKCVGTRTNVAEAMVQRLDKIRSKTILKRYLDMEYSDKIFEKIFLPQSLVLAGHGEHLPDMLGKLLNNDLETLTALMALRSIAHFMGGYGTSIFNKYLTLLKPDNSESLRIGAALCAYGVTEDSKYVKIIEKSLTKKQPKLPIPYLCYLNRKNKKLMAPIVKWKSSKNKQLRGFALEYLKELKQPVALFIFPLEFIQKNGLVHKLFNICKTGNSKSCKEISAPFSFFQKFLSKSENAFWVKTNEQLCKLKGGHGCNHLGVMYGKGDYLPKNTTLSFKYYKKACNYGMPHGCANLAWMYLAGEGVTKNFDQGIKIAKKACILGSGLGCVYVAQEFLTGTNQKIEMDMAYKYYNKACKLKFSKACFTLAQVTSQDKNINDSVKTERILKNLSFSCHYGFTRACHALYEMIPLPEKFQKTKKILPFGKRRNHIKNSDLIDNQ